MVRGQHTPWGPSQYETELAAGIVMHGTAGHGGIQLSPERRKQIGRTSPFLNSPEWWEEDCDWAIPYYFFRADILEASTDKERTTQSIQAAIDTIKGWHKELIAPLGL